MNQTVQKPVVLIAEELSAVTIDVLGDQFDVRFVDGTNREELLKASAQAHALLVRSATKVDREVIQAASQLRIVARAGVGLDNVDIPAATEAGVMVVNAPTSNIISAAELTVAHILGLARNIPIAHASLTAGKWERSRYTGVELYEKTVGIIGLGRIGSLVAQRVNAFQTKTIAFDPYVTAARAQQLGVTLVSFEELLKASDFVTIHMPKTPETIGMIGAQELEMMEPSAFLINVARGGLVDEAALTQALAAQRIAGAALDVFTQEPPVETDFFASPTSVFTPHLGASTHEAREKAGISVAKSVRLALEGEIVPDAVNMAGGIIDPLVRSHITLTEKLGQFLSALVTSSVVSVQIDAEGEIAAHDTDILTRAALKGFFTNMISTSLSYVNAPMIAAGRDVQVEARKSEEWSDYRNLVTVRCALSSGQQLSVSGALFGVHHEEKIVAINEYQLEVPFASHMVAMLYEDKPGVVGIFGYECGKANVNIAQMQIARKEDGGKALSVLTVDSPIPEQIQETIRVAIDAEIFQTVEIVL